MSQYESRKALRKESEETVDYLRATFSRVDKNDFFKIAVLRSLALIIKLLAHQLEHN